MAGYESNGGGPDDPTRASDFGFGAQAYSDMDHHAGSSGDDNQDYGCQPAPTAWHRKPAPLIALGALVAVLLGFVVYGVNVLFTEDSGKAPSNQAPSTTVPAVTPTGTSSTTSVERNITTAAPPTETTTVATTAPPPSTSATTPTTETSTSEANSSTATTTTDTPDRTVIIVPPERRRRGFGG